MFFRMETSSQTNLLRIQSASLSLFSDPLRRWTARPWGDGARVEGAWGISIFHWISKRKHAQTSSCCASHTEHCLHGAIDASAGKLFRQQLQLMCIDIFVYIYIHTPWNPFDLCFDRNRPYFGCVVIQNMCVKTC